ncbi:FIG000605: protein co-occurring with transport systems (COG1739) [hydrothermal vent metagenome]|uniref:FIG000605: protein co-occurring with transport systems (COG1739) n=1 Tax=hydrothermal vent metagenome TaxID=652676 RepID=A0A1W1BM46_9ZZZZ
MFIINKESFYTYEIKRSKFITHIMPFKCFTKRLEELKLQHPKARHFVTSSRYLNNLNQIIESFSDDGEPKGTAGKPSLHVLQGHDLINIASITIRYFGGIKLGTGGLVRAYSDALNLAIDQADLILYQKEECLSFEVAYENLRFVEYTLQKLDIKNVEKRFDTLVHFKVIASKELLENLYSSIKDFTTKL